MPSDDTTTTQPTEPGTSPSGPTTPAPTTPANPPAPTPAAPSPTTGANVGNGEARFTQADLDKVAGQARKDARDAARTQLLKSLGVESEEALQKALKEADDLRKSQMSEQDRIKAEHADMQRKLQDAETQRQQAEAQRQQALIKAEVVAKAAGRFADPNAVVKLLDMGKVKFDGEQVTGVQEALDELAKASPWALLPTKPVVPTIGPTNPAAPGTPAKTNDDELRQIFYGGPKRSSIFG